MRTRPDEVSLATAAMRLRRPYNWTYNRFLDGTLKGRRDGSRLLVAESSLRELEAELTRSDTTAPQPAA